MGALENFLKAPSGGRSWEREKYEASEKKLFCGIKIDAIVRFDLWMRRQNWCHSTKTRFCLSFLAPKRSQSLAKSPPTTLPQPLSLQNDIDFEIFWKYFLSGVFAGNERLYSARPSTSVQQHEGQKSDTDFQKISLLNYRSLHPSKNDICFLLFFWGGLQ